MAFTRNGLSIPAEGLKEIRKITRIEWPSKQNYPDDPVIRSKNTVHHKNIRRAGLFRVSEFGLRIFAIGKIAVNYSGAEILWTKTVAEGSGF